MPTEPLGGLMVPVVSTFHADGALDRLSFTSNIAAHLADGVDGILVAGSSGESALLDDVDRRSLLEWAREQVPSTKWLLAGVGSESTRQTIARAHDAGQIGADAVLVVSPHYYLKRMTEAALLAHFRAVADASAGNLTMLRDYVAAQSATVRVFTGSGATVVPALDAGVSGAILAIALYAGPTVRLMVDALRAGRRDEAVAIQVRLATIATDIAGAFGPAGIKAAMEMVGLSGGPTRSPLLPLSRDEAAMVRARLESAGVLPT